MTAQQWIIAMVCCSLATAEEVMPGTNSAEQISDMAGQSDMYIIGFFCVLFALLISFIVVIVGYYSWLEDVLMKEYLQLAVVYEASVISADFSRAATTTEATTMCAANPEHAQSEYVACVEYRVAQKSKKKITIRKQVKVFACDFKKASGSSSDVPHAIDIEFAASCPTPDDDDMESIICGQEVEVLVMPGYERSGMPRSQVLRTCSPTYRLPTITLLSFLIFLAGVCVYMTVQLTPEALRPSDLATHYLAILILAAVLLIETTFVVGCWGGGMRDGVREIYLQGGDYVKIAHDDTTISSGDDSYLRM